MLAALAALAGAAALTPTVDRRTALALPLAVVPVAARAATDDVIVSGTVNAADAVVGPDAALYVTMRRGGAPQAAFSKFKAVPEPSLAAVRIPMKGKSFPVDFSIHKLFSSPFGSDSRFDPVKATDEPTYKRDLGLMKVVDEGGYKPKSKLTDPTALDPKRMVFTDKMMQ